MALNGNPATVSAFGVDFIDSNSSDLSKLSQLLYIVLKDENLTKKFKVSLATNPNSFSQAYTLLEEDVNASSFAGKRKMRYLLNKVKDYNGSVSGMETYKWANAGTYCGNITLDGNSSFRLPTVEELSQLADYGRISPAIDPIFTNTDSSGYWSSTTYTALGAWNVYFGNGYDRERGKNLTYYVRCVR